MTAGTRLCRYWGGGAWPIPPGAGASVEECLRCEAAVVVDRVVEYGDVALVMRSQPWLGRRVFSLDAASREAAGERDAPQRRGRG